MKLKFKINIQQKNSPIKDKRYYNCYIFSTKEEMWDWNEKDGYNQGRNYLGVARAYKRYFYKDGKRLKKAQDEIGCVCLCVDSCRSGVVAHEFSHATLYWFMDKYKDLNKLQIKKYDELFAWVLGGMVAKFWCQFYKYTGNGKIALENK